MGAFNILIDRMPEEIQGVSIHSDYRRMILFEQLILDSKVGDLDKIKSAIELFYKDPVRDVVKAFDWMLWFYRGGEELVKKEDAGLAKRPPRLYDFETESDLIYASFLDGHHIRLQGTQMHWWEFRALLFTLPEGTPMHDRMMYRAIQDMSGLKPEQIKQIKKMQKIYTIPGYDMPVLTSAQKDKLFLDKMNKRYQQAKEEQERCRIEKLCNR